MTDREIRDSQELVAHAQHIKAWRENLPESSRMTMRKLMQTYPDLGSDKTLLTLASGDLDGRNPSRWLDAYRRVRASMDNNQVPASREGEILDLSNVRKVTPLVYSTIAHNPGIDRLIIIEGTSGAGKTWALRKIKQELPGVVYMMDADDTWQSSRVAAGEMLKAMGTPEGDIPASRAARQALLLSRLQRKVVLLIDEGHHGGAKFLSLLKTILNRSQAIVVLAAMDTLWRKLTSEASEEARQLLHNRLAERVMLTIPTAEDVRTYFADLGDLPGRTAARIAEESARYGHLCFLRRVRKMYLEITSPEDDLAANIAEAVQKSKLQMGAAA